MPFLLLLLSVATLVAVSSTSKASPGGRTHTFTLDANMPEALRNQVIAALVSGADPAALDAFATAIQAQYPLSAGLLHAKATSLRNGAPGVPSLPSPPTDPGGPPLDASMPPAMVTFVHTEQLVNETDLKQAHRAREYARRASIRIAVAALLGQRAAVLNVQPGTPATPSVPAPVVQPAPAPSPSPANPSVPAPLHPRARPRHPR